MSAWEIDWEDHGRQMRREDNGCARYSSRCPLPSVGLETYSKSSTLTCSLSLSLSDNAMHPGLGSTFLETGNRVALVCSARSGNTKATGTTNLLITASMQALRPPGTTTTVNSPSVSQAATPSASSTPTANPLSLTSQVFNRSSSSSNVIPPTGSFSTFNSSFYKDSRSNSPAPPSRGSPTGRRSLSNSITSLRDEAEKGLQAFEVTVEQIRTDHLKAAKLAIRNQEILEALEEEIDYDCDQLRSFLLAAQVSPGTHLSCQQPPSWRLLVPLGRAFGPHTHSLSPSLCCWYSSHVQRGMDGLTDWHASARTLRLLRQILEEISPRSKDTIIGVGERLSCRIVAAVLRDRGIDSELVSLENIIARVSEDEEGLALPDGSGSEGGENLGQHFYDRLAKVIGERLRECGNRVPVVTGGWLLLHRSRTGLLSSTAYGRRRLLSSLCQPPAPALPPSFRLLHPQASSESCLAHCYHRSGEATRISAQHCAPSGLRRANCRSGRRSMVSLRPTRAKWKEPGYCRTSPRRRRPS